MNIYILNVYIQHMYDIRWSKHHIYSTGAKSHTWPGPCVAYNCRMSLSLLTKCEAPRQAMGSDHATPLPVVLQTKGQLAGACLDRGRTWRILPGRSPKTCSWDLWILFWTSAWTSCKEVYSDQLAWKIMSNLVGAWHPRPLRNKMLSKNLLRFQLEATEIGTSSAGMMAVANICRLSG